MPFATWEAFSFIPYSSPAKFKQPNPNQHLFELYNYLFETRNNARDTSIYLCVISS